MTLCEATVYSAVENAEWGMPADAAFEFELFLLVLFLLLFISQAISHNGFIGAFILYFLEIVELEKKEFCLEERWEWW